MSVGVVIGRFQTHELHGGHLELLDLVRDAHPGEFLILLGVGRTPATSRSPLPFRARADMLRAVYPTAVILPLRNCRTDEQWSESIDEKITSVFEYRKATIYSGRDGCLNSYCGRHKTTAILSTVDSESATERRDAVSVAPIDSPDFRAGVIYAISNHPPRIYNTVDMALMRHVNDFGFQGMEILLGQKVDDGEFWRLPGGMVDYTDETYVNAAVREACEETGLCPGIRAFKYVCDMTISDWRGAADSDVKYHTTLFTAMCPISFAQAGDDLVAVKWFSLSQAQQDIAPAHLPLIRATQEYWGND